MERIRIHELAKKLGKENKEILNYLTEKGIQVKSPMNSLEEEQVAMVEDKFGKKETKPEGKAEAAEEKKAPAKKKNIHRYFIRRTAVQVSDAAQEDHKIEQKDSRDAETTARRIIDRMVRHRIVTVRTAQVSREDQEETVRTEADVSVTAIMTPEIRVRDAEMTVKTAQVSREDQEETARMEADVSVMAIMTPEIRARDAEMTVRDHPAEEIREAVWAAVPQ